MPHGSQFCELQLETDEDAAVDADDRDNYYHKCRVSRKRALTNAIGPPMPAAALAGTVALEAAQAREADCEGAGTTQGAAGGKDAGRGQWQPCLGTLPWGTSTPLTTRSSLT